MGPERRTRVEWMLTTLGTTLAATAENDAVKAALPGSLAPGPGDAAADSGLGTIREEELW